MITKASISEQTVYIARMRMITIICLLPMALRVSAQPMPAIQQAWQKMMNSEQLAFASAGICVMDARTGKVLFADNARMGLAPASTTKVLTSIAVLDAVGADFTYPTGIYIKGTILGGTLKGDLIIDGSGDPSLGSWRYTTTKNGAQLSAMAKALKQRGVTNINGDIMVRNHGFDNNPVPPYWPWADMGNYYGAGIWCLNWNENQYDLKFNTGTKSGGLTTIVSKSPDPVPIKNFWNEAEAGGSGDNSIIYTAPYSPNALVQGKLQSGAKSFTVSGAVPDGEKFMLLQLKDALAKEGITCSGSLRTASELSFTGSNTPQVNESELIIKSISPSLDSLIYWFMKKSINLYGEAFVRLIGKEKTGKGTTEAGLSWMESHFKSAGIDPRGMHLTDGSGLSPTNRIAPATLCEALRYAKTRPWFSSFYNSFPTYNGMTLKSGTIHRVKCFAGYHGNYVVAIMVNNYNGSSTALVQHMYAVLNQIK